MYVSKPDFVKDRQIEQMTAQIEEQQALIDYLALMTDVDIPTLEMNTAEEEEEEEEGGEEE